jgi:Family of unknown function (DUF6165)
MPSPPAANLRAPISIGELVDKITILQIKAKRIVDPEKAANVAAELALLRKVRDGSGLNAHALEGFAAQLQTTNQALWDLEDAIRECEALNDFGPHFVELARNIYRMNDQRSAIKRQINLVFGSHIVEEKSYRGT